MKDFKEAKDENLQSGVLKFSVDYVSTNELYKAVSKWVESDKRVLAASIRGGGSNQHAVDFRYDTSELSEDRKDGNVLYTVFKPFFKEYFGEDYLLGWDYASPTIIVK
jgi:hypothetical protein